MAWSTRELADLAGTTVKAVRHYHKLGLLDEPERKTNGYKQYQMPHLMRLLQISRLADLGVPLSQVASMGRADQDPDESFRVLDLELEATIGRLQRIRGELAAIRYHGGAADLPAGFAPVANELTDSERSLVMIYSRLFDDTAMDETRRMLQYEPRTDADTEFEAMTEEADRATRRRLSEKLAPMISPLVEQYPWLGDPGAHATKSAAYANGTISQVLHDIYNRAQLEVLYRAHLINTGAAGDLAALEAALEVAQPATPTQRRATADPLTPRRQDTQ